MDYLPRPRELLLLYRLACAYAAGICFIFFAVDDGQQNSALITQSVLLVGFTIVFTIRSFCRTIGRFLEYRPLVNAVTA